MIRIWTSLFTLSFFIQIDIHLDFHYNKDYYVELFAIHKTVDDSALAIMTGEKIIKKNDEEKIHKKKNLYSEAYV